MNKLKIGNVTLENNLVLAPMAGVTDLPFRLLCRRQGAGLLCMEMVSAKAIYYKNKNTELLMEIHPEEHPVSLQLFGSDPDILAAMAAQIEERHTTPQDMSEGITRFCIGLTKKVVVANAAGKLVEQYLNAPLQELSVAGAWFGVLLYSIQLYYDFSAYSDMAIGLGRMFGFHYHTNFNYPYLAKSVTDFWRRWHISLGSFFRDYVYIPLGGSKKGEGRTYLNLLVVWLFTGLWHGSTLNFLLWGLFLFALISLERLGWGKVLRRSQVISRLYMLLVIPLSWMLFAIPSLKDIGSYIGRLFAFSGGTAVHARDFLVYGRQYAVVLVIGLLVSTPLPEKLWRRIRTSPLGTVLLLVLFWVCVYCMAMATNDPFMYFSF